MTLFIGNWMYVEPLQMLRFSRNAMELYCIYFLKVQQWGDTERKHATSLGEVNVQRFWFVFHASQSETKIHFVQISYFFLKNIDIITAFCAHTVGCAYSMCLNVYEFIKNTSTMFCGRTVLCEWCLIYSTVQLFFIEGKPSWWLFIYPCLSSCNPTVGSHDWDYHKLAV